MRKMYKTVQKVSGVQKAFRKWKEYAVGDIVIGKYVDSHEDKFSKKPCPVIEVEEAFFKDTKVAASVKGKNLVLNHTGMLGKAFEKIEFGQLVQVTYDGTSTIETGPFAGKESHLTRVDIVVEDDGQHEMVMNEGDEGGYEDDL